jgi:2-iminobutanoate/2-iminopropanoate deaminase
MSIQAPNKTIVTVGTAPASPYSHAVKSGGLIYLSGGLSQDASGNITPKGDIKGQTKGTIERMRTILAAAGSSLDQMVAVTTTGACRPIPTSPSTLRVERWVG